MTDERDDCCSSPAPPPRSNPAGLPEIRYRIGDQPAFFRAMVDRLSKQVVPPDANPATGQRPLAELRVRSLEDGTIAILDAFACVCDVLTFYGERYFNEAFLRTATERRSSLEIARSIGFVPGPGVAASTRLAFSLEQADPDYTVAVPERTAVMSVPAPGQLPVTFETVEDLFARAEWSTLRPAAGGHQQLDHTTTSIYLDGTATRLGVGDPIVVLGQRRSDDDGGAEIVERWDLRFVTKVEAPDVERRHTLVHLDRPLGDHDGLPGPPSLPRTLPAEDAQRVFTFRERGSLFGYNAPDFRAMSEDIQVAFGGDPWAGVDIDNRKKRWPNFDMEDDATTGRFLDQTPRRGVIDLDREYPSIVDQSWICLEGRTEVELYKVVRASPTSREDFSLTAKCTRVFLDGYERLRRFKRRSTAVHLASEEMPMAARPWRHPVSGHTIELDRKVEAMEVGRPVLVRGEIAAGLPESGTPVAEVAIVKSWNNADERSVVTFEQSLAHTYARASMTLHGNVASATHGETVAAEAIGSGNAALPHQQFALRQGPLTYVPGVDVEDGVASTLEIRVDGELWDETREGLLSSGPTDHDYEVSVTDEAQTIVQLGDGLRGARARTGRENVIATYRKGVGLAGEMVPDQLTLLRAAPMGVVGVTNPMPATGAADPDDAESLSVSAPLTVLTLDRLVSLQDYEDYARAYPGIGKARAVALWDGKRGFVHLTVASQSGQVLPVDGETMKALRGAIDGRRDPAHIFVADPHVPRSFGLVVRLLIDEAFEFAPVAAEVRDRLLERFSFSQRQFGQSVAASEVTSGVHEVRGVVAADLDALHQGIAATLSDRLPAARARFDGGSVGLAELLLIDPARIEIGKME